MSSSYLHFSAGAGLAGTHTQPAAARMQAFWKELATVTELKKIGSHSFLQLGGTACFPLEGTTVQNTILIRQCYFDIKKLMDGHFAAGGRSFILTGNPGRMIGSIAQITCPVFPGPDAHML